jgi:hypothetical protein
MFQQTFPLMVPPGNVSPESSMSFGMTPQVAAKAS